MKNQENLVKEIDRILHLESPAEMVAEFDKLGIPTGGTNAFGGNGGQSISLTYVDNYSSLMLVYTFLLSQLDNKKKYSSEESFALNRSLLQVLKRSMDEQQQYRKAFLETVNKLNKTK